MHVERARSRARNISPDVLGSRGVSFSSYWVIMIGPVSDHQAVMDLMGSNLICLSFPHLEASRRSSFHFSIFAKACSAWIFWFTPLGNVIVTRVLMSGRSAEVDRPSRRFLNGFTSLTRRSLGIMMISTLCSIVLIILVLWS